VSVYTRKHAVLEWREYEKIMVEHGDDAAKEHLADGSEELLGVAPYNWTQ